MSDRGGSVNRDALKAAATAATPGPWYREYGDVVTAVDDPRDVAEGYDEPRSMRISRRAPHLEMRDPRAIADAEFIAAANPAVVQSLLADLDATEALLRDFADNGVRLDLNPTMDCGSTERLYVAMTAYLKRIDDEVRARARRALHGGTDDA